MSFMWRPETFETDARSIAVTAPAAAAPDLGERRLRAQVWGTLLAANLVASTAGLWLVGSAIL